MTYYDILGVPSSASLEDIKKAYRNQVRFFHPDLFEGSEDVARIKTQQLNAAYEVLSVPAKRAAYDLTIGLRSQSIPKAPPKEPPQEPPPKPTKAPPAEKKRKETETAKQVAENELIKRNKKIITVAVVSFMVLWFICDSKFNGTFNTNPLTPDEFFAAIIGFAFVWVIRGLIPGGCGALFVLILYSVLYRENANKKDLPRHKDILRYGTKLSMLSGYIVYFLMLILNVMGIISIF